MKRFVSSFITFLSVMVFAGSVYVFIYQDDVTDWWMLRHYTPPAEIAALADDTTMTDLGQRYFFVYQPELLSRDTFRSRCTIAEKSIILGCYVSQRGIYIYDVQDEQLEGIKQVTAAHEMLHVAYERLSLRERERIDELTLAVYDDLDNPRIRRTMQAYRERDPGIVANELHSILPTEVREIGDELEEYYRQFFDDRQVVVDFAEQYEAVFEAARTRVEALDVQLKSKRSDIETRQQQLDSLALQLQQDRDRLNQLLDDNNVDAYNAGVGGFNAQVQRYNDTVASLQRDIDNYNDLVSERNDAVVAYGSLTEAIDTRPEPIMDQL